MSFPLSLFIGQRFSKGKKRNRFVSFISVSSMIGISVGVMVIIIGLSAMNGFENELNNRVLSVIPHAQLEGVNAPLISWKEMQEKAHLNPRVKATAPYVLFTGLLERGAKIQPVQFRGIDTKAESKLSTIEKYVLDEGWSALKPGQHAVILGKGIADALGVKTGDVLTALLPPSNPTLKLMALTRIRLNVVGILNLAGQMDHVLALIPLEDAQDYLKIDNGVSGLALTFYSPLEAASIVREVGMTLKEHVYLKNWTQEYGYLHRDIQMVRMIVYIVMVLVIGVACFNIVSTLMMAVKDRAADIAVLRTMGAKDSLIRSIFIWNGLLSGISGGLIGSVAGGVISLYLTDLVQFLEGVTGDKFISGDVYFVDFLPTQVYWSDIFVVSMTALLLSLLATWYPSKRACQLQPAFVLSAR